MNTPGYALDAKTAHKVGLVQELVTDKAGLDHVLDSLLQDPEFLEKPDSLRGLSQFESVEDYPEEIQQKYHLANITEETRKQAGVFSQQSWQVANRLIEQSDLMNAGDFSDQEMRSMMRNTRKKQDKVEALVDAGKSHMKGKTGENLTKLFKTLILTPHLLSGGAQ
jgi:enoyl-CoA hydratase/carnithine racemase